MTDIALDEKLAPCPFCGKEPILIKLVEDDYDRWHKVMCEECGIEMGEEYRSDAIAAWNRRASPSQVAPQPANPAQVTDAKELADRITDYLTNGGLFNPEMMPHGPARDLLIDCRSTLTAIGAGGQAVAVAVRALEWEDREEKRLGAITEKYWRAQTAFDWGYRVKAYGKGFSFGDAIEYPTVETAKDAAQADYECRIRSALSQPHPADERAVEARNYEAFRTFAHEATKAITNLTGGGSEYFGKEVDGVFLADLPRCVERLRHRIDVAARLAKEGR